MRLSERSAMNEEYRLHLEREMFNDYEKQRQILKCIIMWACARASWLERGDVRSCMKKMFDPGEL